MGGVRSTGNSTRGCLPLLETDNSVFGQGGVAEHGDRVMDNHHVLLISGDRPALVVQGPLQCFIWVYLLFVVVSNIMKVKVDIEEDITRVIFPTLCFP